MHPYPSDISNIYFIAMKTYPVIVIFLARQVSLQILLLLECMKLPTPCLSSHYRLCNNAHYLLLLTVNFVIQMRVGCFSAAKCAQDDWKCQIQQCFLVVYHTTTNHAPCYLISVIFGWESVLLVIQTSVYEAQHVFVQ